MRRTTVYLEPDLDLQIKAEARRLNQPVAQLIRDALRDRLARAPRSRSPHAGGFASGGPNTASTADGVLRETGFGTTE